MSAEPCLVKHSSLLRRPDQLNLFRQKKHSIRIAGTNDFFIFKHFVLFLVRIESIISGAVLNCAALVAPSSTAALTAAGNAVWGVKQRGSTWT